jgi:alpha/beta superfamily hydrolase
VERPPSAEGRGTIERVAIPGGAGHELAGLRQDPAGASRGVVVLAPAFASSKDLRGLRRVADGLAARGWSSLRFDFTGLGDSSGDFAETTLSTNVADVLAVGAWLRERGTPARMILGLSLGGIASILAAPRLPELAVLGTLAAPSSTTYLRDLLLARAPRLTSEGRAEIDLLGDRVTVGRALAEDLPRWNVLDAVSRLPVPYVIFHSKADAIVGVGHAGDLFRAAPHPRSFVSLDQADHLLLNDARDATLVADVLSAFGERFAGASGTAP